MKNTSFLILYLCVILLCSCRKYDEGPLVSFRNPREVIAGNWRISSYTVDGADSMWVINGLHLQGNFEFKPYYDNDDLPELFVFTKEDTIDYIYGSRWKYEKRSGSHMVELHINDFRRGIKIEDFNSEMMPFRLLYWKITRLKHSKEMWLRVEENGKQYGLKFKAI